MAGEVGVIGDFGEDFGNMVCPSFISTVEGFVTFGETKLRFGEVSS